MSARKCAAIVTGALMVMGAWSAPIQARSVDRTRVKHSTDAEVKKIDLKPTEISIEELIVLRDRTCAVVDFEKLGDRRFAPFETTLYRISGTLKSIRLDKEGDVNFIVAGASGAEAVIEIPEADECKGSPLLKRMTEVRSILERRFRPKAEAIEVNERVTLDGIGYLGSRRRPGAKPFGENVRLMPAIRIRFESGMKSASLRPLVVSRGYEGFGPIAVSI